MSRFQKRGSRFGADDNESRSNNVNVCFKFRLSKAAFSGMRSPSAAASVAEGAVTPRAFRRVSASEE